MKHYKSTARNSMDTLTSYFTPSLEWHEENAIETVKSFFYGINVKTQSMEKSNMVVGSTCSLDTFLITFYLLNQGRQVYLKEIDEMSSSLLLNAFEQWIKAILIRQGLTYSIKTKNLFQKSSGKILKNS